MFSFLLTATGRARRDARNWLEVAARVRNYRRDQLTEAQLRELQGAETELRSRLKQRADAAKLKLGIEALEACLRKCGGRQYPRGSLAENVEFFLAAAIVILGIRAYLVQPFKIPTNSMWPSYHGMTHEVFSSPDETPGWAARVARLAAFGAVRRAAEAPAAGEVRVPFVYRGGRLFVPYGVVRDRKWLLLPTTVREYVLLVGDRPTTVRVPLDFDFDRVVQDAFFDGRTDLVAAVQAAAQAGKVQESFVNLRGPAGSQPERVLLVATGRTVRAGEPALAFDILTGDQLFVDRFSYHFFKPEVGQGFVFRTGGIPGLGRTVVGDDGRPRTVRDDKYYIKRLVGLPGDTLEIRAPVLWRNGAPIEGAAAFTWNARRERRYPGYQNAGALAVGETMVVPPDGFLALGDNSPNSLDGRMWGFVPEKDVVGRPLFIYYPFSRRWGPAR